MNGCSKVQANFSEYLDSQLTGREMQRIAAHLENCRECAREWASLRQAQASLGALGPVPAPKDLGLRIRVALSQELARSRRSPFQGWNLAWKNTLGPFLLLVTVSLILCAVRLKTRSLAASTIVHSCYNFMIFATMLISTGGFRHLDKM